MLGEIRHYIGLVIFLILWEIISRSGLISSDYMPSVGTIGAATLDFLQSERFWVSLSTTVQRVLIGFVIAVTLALLLAVLAGRFRLIYRAFGPITDILRSLPPPALIPLLIFVLGVGPSLFYFVVIFGCMWPTYVSASNALSTTEPVQINTARSFGLTDWQIMWQIRIPSALPEAFTGIRLSAGIALLSSVATDMLVGGTGLGALIFDAGFSLLWDDMYALMFVIGILGMLLNFLVNAIRWRLAGWQSLYAALGART